MGSNGTGHWRGSEYCQRIKRIKIPGFDSGYYIQEWLAPKVYSSLILGHFA